MFLCREKTKTATLKFSKMALVSSLSLKIIEYVNVHGTQDASVFTDFRLCARQVPTLHLCLLITGPILLVGPPLKIPFSVSAVKTLSDECENRLLA